MPYTVNGIGTSVCSARGDLTWDEGSTDCDAVECLVFFFMPVLPYKCAHTYEWTAAGNQYKSIPIRWSLGLLLRAYARRWLLIPGIGGCVFAFTGMVMAGSGFSDSHAAGAHSDIVAGFSVMGGGIAVALVAWGIWKLLEKTDRRTRDIRLVLGRHQFGSSDPATWKSDLLAAIKSPQELHGTSTHADGVNAMLGKARYSAAMWAARLSAALENRAQGEALTDEILTHPSVADALPQLRKNPKDWAQLMRPGA